MRRLSALLLLTASAAFSQLDDNTITITASRQVTLQPDQMVFSVSVQAPETAGLNDVLTMLPGTGITEANLAEVYGNSPNGLQWYFTLATSFSESGATVSLLTQLESNSKGAVSFYVQGTQVSQALQQSQPCSQTALVADAQKQARALASATGFTVGPVLAVSDGSGVAATGIIGAARVTNVLTVGDFLAATVYNEVLPTTNTCAAVVQFQLYSYH